jgi:hypothetical protein
MFGAVAVVIDVAPEVEAPLAEVAVQSCDAALGAGRCGFGRQAGVEPQAEWYAVVRWEGDRLEIAHIEFRRRNSEGPLVRSRQIMFSSRDDARDRWASVGVLVAALVAAEEERAPPLPEPVPSAEPMRDTGAAPREVPGKLHPQSTWRLDAAFTLARALERGALQPGVTLRPSLELARLPLFLSGSLGYAARPSGEPAMSWVSESLGFGVRMGGRHAAFATELRSELISEQWLIAASAAERSDSEWVVRLGARMGLDTLWRMTPHVSLLAGVQASVVRPEIAVDVEGRPVDRVPGYAVSVLAGVRFLP